MAQVISKKNIFLSLGLIAISALTACTSMPSKPLTFNDLGRFDSYPLNNQSFRVSFKTERSISYGSAEEIALLKAAQVTVKSGFQYFKVMNDPSNRTQQPPRQAVVYPAPVYNPYPYGRYHRGPFYDPFFYNPPQVVTIDPIEVSYTIECFKDQKSAPSDAFDARLILRTLGAKYALSPTGDVIQPPVVTKPAP
ncbi:hypothetical protein EC844_10499 [Acinetobacter calcoaceticus]|uniref:Lipoprotein n=1 Tax=Acinetobacter calcoaceticus TaxID=471 RepID=A0A4R1Y8H0_ACICA|nr:hypothetical protein EC844_10499 [Acinetobacter calcoaceticus]